MTLFDLEKHSPFERFEQKTKPPLTIDQLRQSLKELQHTWVTLGGESDLFISPNFETLTPFFWEELLEMVEKLKKGEVDRGEVADFFITAENILLTLLLAGREDKSLFPDTLIPRVYKRLERADYSHVSTTELVEAGKQAYLSLIPQLDDLGIDGQYFDHYSQVDEEHHRAVFNDLLAKLNQIPVAEFQRHYVEQRHQLLDQMANLYAMGLSIAQENGLSYEAVLEEKKTKTLLNILRWERPLRQEGGDKQAVIDRMLYMLRRYSYFTRAEGELVPVRSTLPMGDYPLNEILSRYPDVPRWKVHEVAPEWDSLSTSQRCAVLSERFKQLVGKEDSALQNWLKKRAENFAVVEELLDAVKKDWDTLPANERYKIVVDFLRKLREDVKFDDMVLQQA